MDQDQLETLVTDALDELPTHSLSEHTLHGLLTQRGYNVDRKELARVLDQMVAAGQLEVVDEERGVRRYGLSDG